jgi:thioredoxin reductase (NADPH)
MTTDTAAPLDPGDGRHYQRFPSLNEEQFELLMRYGQRRLFGAGEVLFRQGERHTPMFVILSGQIDVTRSSPLGSHLIASLGPGMFGGEAGTLAGRAALATGVAATDCDVIVIDEEALRTLVITEADLSEMIMRAFILRRVAYIGEQCGGVILFGSRHSAETLRLREFMARNGQPAAYFDVDEHEATAALMERFGAGAGDIPALVTPQGTLLKQPGLRELADATGISPDDLDGKSFDVAVLGTGPGGLAAAVYAASEGLTVAVLDSKAPGGQAGTTSKIENYFGFPTGISGQALAGRGLAQARKFGAEVAVPIAVRDVVCAPSQDGFAQHGFDIGLDSGERIHARTIVVATGARYRKPDLPELPRFEGRGVYYNASFMEATFCGGEEVVIVGGGNSAGQAAVFLSNFARHVHIMVRAPSLAASMSHYLIQRIDAASQITVHSLTRIVELQGGDRLERIRVQSGAGEPREMEMRHVFLFLGAEPNTGWLGGCVALDARDFVLTGPAVPKDKWPLERAPHNLETSRPGIFAVGDVRSGSVKRVATAVGEGAAAVQSLHQVLAS